MKLSGVPHLLRHTIVTPEKYRGIVRSEHCTPEGRTAGMSLKLNTWNYFQLTASGILQAYPSYLSCKGQETRHGEELVENEVTVLELRVRVQSEKVLVHKVNVENVTDHLHLPCTVREEGCETTAKTYMWTNKETPCKLHRIRSISPALSGQRGWWTTAHS